uniref:Histone-lysine N-methyltransferase n=1 Tax=Anopheles farauti TaxID=69004 RepID=A0A182QQP9_9DIPT
MDFIGDLLNQMSSAFNQETAIPKKEEISMDETLKWRALKNNQFASRTRLSQHQQQQQQQTGSGGGSGTRSGLTNGRRSASGGGSTPGGSSRQRRGTSAGNSRDSASGFPANDDGSRSPAALLGDNGSLTPEVDPDDQDIEIEIAKDISGEELQEALGLSQLVEVETEDTGSQLEAAAIEHAEEQLEQKSSPTMEADRERVEVNVEETIGAGDCKPEDELDTKSSLEVPYSSSSASVSPAVLTEGKAPNVEQVLLLPTKRDTDEAASIAAGEEKSTDDTDRLATEEAESSKSIKTTPLDVPEEAATEEVDQQREDTGVVTAPVEDDDEEDDILIISTNSVDEVVELAETSKEDEDDEEIDEPVQTLPEATNNSSQNESEARKDRDEKEPVAVETVPAGNDVDDREEKFHPKLTENEEDNGEEKDKVQSDKVDNTGASPVDGDAEEVKFSETLKPSVSAEAKQNHSRSSSVEKVEDKKDTAEEEPKSNAETAIDTSAMNESKDSSAENKGQPSSGRTTRSRKIASGSSVVVASPAAGVAAVTHLQRRSQRFQKESSVAPAETAGEPTIVVKEEEPDDGAGAPKKRASVGVGASGEVRPKSTLKSDRSLRSKQPNQPTVTTRRASETVKASPTDDDQDGQDKAIADRRRGRKRLSQDRSQSSSVASNDAAVRTREKLVREEQPSATAGDEPRRESRSGFPLDPGESDTGGRKQEAQGEQPQQRRGRKRKNPSDGSPSAATAASTTAGTTGTTTTSAGSAATNADKAPLHPYKRAARMSRDGSDGILASALARRDKVDSQGRLSRPIKLSAKILANEELRQGFEQHNNGRIIIGSEQPAAAVVVTAQEDDPTPVQREMEPEARRKAVSVASCTTIGSSSEDVTLVSVTLPAPKPASSTSKTGDRERDLQLGRQPIESTSNERTGPRVPAMKRTSRATGTGAGTCPDVQTFLKEVRLMHLGTNRSPEDNPKLNRRQQKRLAKLKEKHFMGLGLQRRGAHQPHRNGGTADENDFDAELSVGESESSGSEADFVPTKKIGTVGKPSVTLRLRKPETLLENPPRRGGAGPNAAAPAAASRVPLVTVPSGAVNMSSRATINAVPSRQSQAAAAARQAAGKQANGRTMPVTNGPGTSRRTVPLVVLPAVSTTVGARTSSLAVTSEPSISATTLGKKETEHLQRSLARLGCEVTVVPSTGSRTVPVVENATPSRPPPTPWTMQRGAEVTSSRTRPNVPILPGTTSPSLQVTLGNRPISGPAPPVRGSTGKTSSRTTPPTTTPSPATGEPTLVCLCRQESEIFVSRTVGNGYCTAVDDIDGQQIGCCNELSSDMVNMLRPSPAVSFQLLCNLHRKRLEDHSCCAVCGWFCTQGQFAMCKNVHLFHPNCADKYTLNTPYNPARPTERVAPTLVLKCPHCNQECPNGEIEVNVQLTSAPVLLPSRKSIVKPAMMTVSKGNTANGDGGASGDGFRTTVESLVPSSVKYLLSTDHSRSNGGALNASTSAGSSAGGRSSTSSAKDMGGGATVGKKNFTAKDFSQACTKNDDARVSEIITAGFDIETRFREFHHGTCLHVVCSSGTLAMAYLIMCRARSVNYLNIVDRELHTALMCAVLNSKSDIVKLLLDSGADATLKGPYGMTVLHLAARSGQHATVRTILECARQRLTARDLMAFVDAIDNGHWTALAWAAENRHKQTVEQLIAIGADVNVCDRSNNTALHWASLSGCSDTLYLLLTKNCNTNMQNTNGETPLHIACRQGHAEICVVLLAMGASLNIRNTANELPQDIIEDRNSECANIIAANLKMRNLAKNMKETHIISSDISNGKERHPVQVVYYTRGANDRQLTMPKFKYVQHNVQLDSCITIDPQARTMPICSCTDSCTSADSKCLCSARTWYTSDGRLVSDFNYLDPPTIVECGELCDCNRRLCRNRVVQHGLDVPLQLCYIPGKAWGVRTMVPIPKGSFLVEYVGELVTDEAANHRSDDSYLFDLGNGFCIDANTYGNVSRFFNHSCQPNVTPVSVYYDHADQRFPRVALFACRDIGAQEEICFDYGEKFWMVKKRVLVCRCSTSQCRYRETE